MDSANIEKVKSAGLCESQDVIISSLDGRVDDSATDKTANLLLQIDNARARSGLGKYY